MRKTDEGNPFPYGNAEYHFSIKMAIIGKNSMIKKTSNDIV